MRKVKVKMEMVVNSDYVRVKKCCASCVNRCLEEDGSRKCQIKGLKVRGCGLCENWQMSEELQQLRRTQGCIKSRAYQMYVLKVREEEANLKARNLPVTPASIASIRRDFEALQGEVFVEF